MRGDLFLDLQEGRIRVGILIGEEVSNKRMYKGRGGVCTRGACGMEDDLSVISGPIK